MRRRLRLRPRPLHRLRGVPRRLRHRERRGARHRLAAVSTFNPARHPALPTRHLSLACNHCDTPGLPLGCPAAAYRRDEATGAVLLDAEPCIGCRYCSWVCPYDAPRFDEARGVMTKCTFCAPRLAEGGPPACAAACPTGALAWAARRIGAAGRAVVPRPGSVRSRPVARREAASPGAPPGARSPTTRRPSRRAVPPRPRKITLASEWGLLLFTLVMPALVAWLGGGLRAPRARPALVPFLALGALALALSTLHLGQPLRAWRAILDVDVLAQRARSSSQLFLSLGSRSSRCRMPRWRSASRRSSPGSPSPLDRRRLPRHPARLGAAPPRRRGDDRVPPPRRDRRRPPPLSSPPSRC